MEVVVAFGDGVVRGCDYGREEVGLLEVGGLEVEVPDEVFEDAELLVGMSVIEGREVKCWNNAHARQKADS